MNVKIDTLPTQSCVFPDLSEAGMRQLANDIASLLDIVDCVTLSGTLGAGKTSFVRSCIQAMTNDLQQVSSPTFTISQTYARQCDGAEIVHFDLYRIEHAEELIEVGLEEALEDAITFIEWPDIAAFYLPPERIHIDVAFAKSDDYRTVEITGSTTWMKRLYHLPLLNRLCPC